MTSLEPVSFSRRTLQVSKFASKIELEISREQIYIQDHNVVITFKSPFQLCRSSLLMFHFNVVIFTLVLYFTQTKQVPSSCCSFSHFNMLAHQFHSPWIFYASFVKTCNYVTYGSLRVPFLQWLLSWSPLIRYSWAPRCIQTFMEILTPFIHQKVTPQILLAYAWGRRKETTDHFLQCWGIAVKLYALFVSIMKVQPLRIVFLFYKHTFLENFYAGNSQLFRSSVSFKTLSSLPCFEICNFITIYFNSVFTRKCLSSSLFFFVCNQQHKYCAPEV